MNNTNAYNQLSLKEKADLFKIYAANGYTSLDSIKEHYNKFADGGEKDTIPMAMDENGNLIDTINPSVIKARGKSPSFISEGKKLIKSLKSGNISGILGSAANVFNKLPKKFKERAVELALRANHEGGGAEESLKEYIDKTYGKPDLLKKDIQYVLTGKGAPSVNNNDGLYYYADEKSRIPIMGEKIENDIIDAVAKGVKLNPNIALQVNGENGYGIEDSYINKNYPGRKIQYVQTNPPGVNYSQEGITSTNIVGSAGSFVTSNPKVRIDNAGIVLEYGNRNDSTFVRGWDVYDFASPDGDKSGYITRWGNISKTDDGVKDAALIKILDKNTYPLVIRTPWVYEEDINRIIRANGGNLFYPGGDLNNILWDPNNTLLTSMEPEEMYSDIISPSTVTATSPSIFTPQGRRAATNMARRISQGLDTVGTVPLGYRNYVEGELKGAYPVSHSISNAGENIYNGIDKVTAWIPGPVGTVNWLGHMGADAIQGNWGKVGQDAALAAAMGKGAKLVGKGVEKLAQHSDKFKGALDKPTEYDEREVLDYLYSAANNVKKNIKLKGLKEGDIVGMFFRNSPNLEKAYNNGSNNEVQTHTGHIVMRHNKPYVEHNVHGDIKLNRVKDVLGKNNPYGIVSVYRMRNQGGPIEDTPTYIDKYDRISNERYNTALSTVSSIIEDSKRADILARILSAQSIAETGWVDNNDSNNYGGYKANGKVMKFDSPDDFWKYHINNLDTKWSTWRDAIDLNDYLRIINNSDLGLTTKELFNAYNKEHRENPAYIYAPAWENSDYEELVKSVSKRASMYLPTE